MEATNGGTLYIPAFQDNSGGGVIQANGGTVQFNANMQGGTLRTTNNGTVTGTGIIGYLSPTVVDNQAGGTINANSGSLVFSASSTVTNAGLMEATPGGTLELQGTVTNTAGTVTANGATVKLSGGSILGGTVSVINGGTISGGGTLDAQSLTNQGTIVANSGQLLLSSPTTVTNTGLITSTGSNTLKFQNAAVDNTGGNITANGGTVLLDTSSSSPGVTISGGAVNIQNGGTFTTTGSYTNSSDIFIGNAPNDTHQNHVNVIDKLVNHGSVTFSGANDHLYAGTIVNNGTVTMTGMNMLLSTGGGDELDTVSFTNMGGVLVGKNELLAVSAFFFQDSGTLEVNGSLTTEGLLINGGEVSGSGTITGSITNTAGTVSASDPGTPDIVTINGNYTQGSGGTFEDFLGGASAGNGLNFYGRLVVNGQVSLSGTLDLMLVNGFAPTAGETFLLLTSTGTLSGSFSNLVLPAGGFWYLSYNNGCGAGNAGCVVVTFENVAGTPEPSTMWLLLGGIVIAIAISRSSLV
jgi:hypothetical protein